MFLRRLTGTYGPYTERRGFVSQTKIDRITPMVAPTKLSVMLFFNASSDIGSRSTSHQFFQLMSEKALASGTMM